MAKKSSKKEQGAPQERSEAQSEGMQQYEVKATRNLGMTITGGPSIPKGKSGTVEMEPARYERLKSAGYFEDAK